MTRLAPGPRGADPFPVRPIESVAEEIDSSPID
jgi:hypothetical protein